MLVKCHELVRNWQYLFHYHNILLVYFFQVHLGKIPHLYSNRLVRYMIEEDILFYAAAVHLALSEPGYYWYIPVSALVA